VPQIEVTFDIDANGIVNVSAKDRATGKEQSITITGQSSLSKEQIEQMVRDAEAHAEEDRRRREAADARNRADTLVYQTEKLLSEQGDKVPADDKASVESALSELKSALGTDDLDRINSAAEALSAATQKLSQALYEQAAAQADTTQAGGGDGAASDGGDDDVVDAEIVEDDK